MTTRLAVIGGYADGLGAAQATALRHAGWSVVGISRSGKGGYTCDLTDADAVTTTLEQIETEHGPIDAYLHNPHALVRGSITSLTAKDFETAWQAAVGTAVNVTLALVPKFIEREGGTFLFTGATASVKGGPRFAPFASAKFALRGLAQSLARELGPQNIHVVHLILDGLIEGPQTTERFNAPVEATIDADAIGELTVHLLNQPSRAWTHEIDVRRGAESW